jgi:hypothetical protein
MTSYDRDHDVAFVDSHGAPVVPKFWLDQATSPPERCAVLLPMARAPGNPLAKGRLFQPC